jgi:hypothetical protein
MYFWNISALKNDLINNKLNEHADFMYLRAMLILLTLGAYPFETSNTFDTYSWLINLFIVGLGTFICFKANGANDGKYFLQRYLSIAWVMSVKLVVFFIPSIVTLNIALEILGVAVPDETSLLDAGLVAAVSIVYYWRVSHHISQVSSINANYKDAHRKNAK